MNYNIKQDNTRRNKWYCALKNPNVDYYDVKVIQGGSPEIVEKKVKNQLKKWSAERDK